MKKKSRRKYFREFVEKFPKISISAKSGTFFILSFTQLIQRGRLADLKNTPSKSRDLWAPPLTTKQKHKTCTKNKMSKKSKKQKKTAPKPPKNSNLPSFCVLWPLCISFSFCDPPSPLGFLRFFSNFGLEKFRPLWPGHDMVEGVASLKKTLNSSPLKIIRPLGNLGDSELGISESFLGWANWR